MTSARLTMYAMTALIFGVASPAAVAQSLDYDYFKANVQPIFLKKRAGHARCVVCHAESNNAFRLQSLPQGSDAWTEEQTRKNFEAVKVLVRNGALAIETVGRLVACGAGRACAVLASGKHVEGQLADGRLIVEVP